MSLDRSYEVIEEFHVWDNTALAQWLLAEARFGVDHLLGVAVEADMQLAWLRDNAAWLLEEARWHAECWSPQSGRLPWEFP